MPITLMKRTSIGVLPSARWQEESVSLLSRLRQFFKEETGTSPTRYLRSLRLPLTGYYCHPRKAYLAGANPPPN